MKRALLGLTLFAFAGFLTAAEPAKVENNGICDIYTDANANNDVIKGLSTYFAIGVGPLPVLLPTFSLHLKYQHNHFGMDNSLTVATVHKATAAKYSSTYYYYPRPSTKQQFYYGGGIGVTAAWAENYHIDNTAWFLSPELVIGKQYTTKSKDKRFIEGQVGFPSFCLNKHVDHRPFFMPIVTVKYGIHF